MQTNTNGVSWFSLIDYVVEMRFFELVANIPLYLDPILPISLVAQCEFPTANLDILILVSTENEKRYQYVSKCFIEHQNWIHSSHNQP